MAIVLGMACGVASAQAMYRMIDLGTLGGANSAGAALNSKGQATGFSDTSGVTAHAFLWRNNGTQMQDLGDLGGNTSTGVAINSSGQVTGYAYPTSSGGPSRYHAFIWKNDGTPMQDLGVFPGGVSSDGVAINNLGQVAGDADTSAGPTHAFITHAFIWKNDGRPIQDLGALGGNENTSNVNDINDAGQVIGDSYIGGGASHGFIWKNDGTPMHDLGTLGGAGDTFANAINSFGQVTGGSPNRSGRNHAFLWRNDGTPMQDLGDLYGSGSGGVAINDSGQVMGDVCTKRCFFQHAFLWKNDGTPMIDLRTLGGHNSTGEAINNSGQVTGFSNLADKTVRAFLWRNDGTKLQDVNALIDPVDPLKPYVVLTEGLDINDAGEILVNGTDSRTGDRHAYLLQGTVLTLMPRSLAFGDQKVNTTSAAKSITVTNTSASAVPITSIALAGTGARQFAITDNCRKSLAGKATCTIETVFKPKTKGAKSAALNLNGGGGGLR
ncbi:MAG TPA: choice-of-anchor D domain-containing protein, partial [Candidatus Saccharimonadales bacterium]|nr:choice-of-anchor D domain-containing protein [Candidatus Saccharimonadales bacterium]